MTEEKPNGDPPGTSVPVAPGAPTPQQTSGAAPPPARPRNRRLRAAAVVLALAAAGFAAWYFFLRTPEPKDDLGRFQGEWQLFQADGQDQTKGRVKPVTVRVTGDRWEFLDRERVIRRYTLTLRPGANPKEIDLVLLDPNGKPVLEQRDRGGPFVPVTLHGIYEIDRDQGKLFLVPGGEPRPTSFDATEGKAVQLLERLK